MVRNSRVVLGDQDWRPDIFHGQITKIKIADVASAIAIRLDPHPIVRSLELHAGYMNVLYAAGYFAANRETMPMHKGAVRDGDISARRIRSG